MTNVVSEQRLAMPTAAAMKGMQPQLDRLLEDLAGTMTSVMCILGVRLGLFRELASSGSVTSHELATRTGLDERYVREWSHCLASAGYLEVDERSDQFRLVPALDFALGADDSPFNLAPAYELIPPLLSAIPAVTAVFHTGAGISPQHYDDALFVAMERLSASWLNSMLISLWVPSVSGLADRLAMGARVVDVGCGGGHALILLGKAFPNSSFVGYDMVPGNVDRARAAAAAAGVADVVKFEHGDATENLQGPIDLVTAFHVLHDAPNPGKLLRGLRAALNPEGVLLVLESNTAEAAVHNRGPVATILYATSVLYCLPSSLALGGDGLGTMGLPASRIRDLCAGANLRAVRPLPSMTPFDVLYEIRPG